MRRATCTQAALPLRSRAGGSRACSPSPETPSHRCGPCCVPSARACIGRGHSVAMGPQQCPTPFGGPSTVDVELCKAPPGTTRQRSPVASVVACVHLGSQAQQQFAAAGAGAGAGTQTGSTECFELAQGESTAGQDRCTCNKCGSVLCRPIHTVGQRWVNEPGPSAHPSSHPS